MKRTLAPLAITALALTAACSDGGQTPLASPAGRTAPVLSAAPGRGIEGQYIVVLNDGADPRSVAAIAGVSPRHVYTAALDGFAAALNAGQLNALQNNPNVRYIEQDQVVTLAASQSGATWGLDRIDQRDLPLNSTYNYTPTGAGVRAYIIDTGINTGHTDFGGRASVAWDGIGDGNDDCNGHGTHVAGTVGSTTYGVAKGVTLVGVRVFACGNTGSNSTIIAGINWTAANAVKPAVANMSLGGPASTATDDAVNGLINAGVIAVVAAGNENQNACNVSPARVPNAITVGSTTSTDARSSFSNYGSCVDIFAPGSSILSTWIGSTTATSTISGTSMASPHVAGAAALYLQGSPGASAATVHGFIVNDASTSKLSSIGTGSPNRLLFTLATVDPLTVSISGPTYITVSGEYTWTASFTGGTVAPEFTWEVSWDGLFWSPLGSGPSQTYWAGGVDFYLRLTGTRGTDGAQAQAVIFVQAPCMETNPEYACS